MVLNKRCKIIYHYIYLKENRHKNNKVLTNNSSNDDKYLMLNTIYVMIHAVHREN